MWLKVITKGMVGYYNQESFSNIEVVDFASLVADSAKLKHLDVVRLKEDTEGNIFFLHYLLTSCWLSWREMAIEFLSSARWLKW